MSTDSDPDGVLDLESIKSRFIACRGYWRPWTEALLRENPRFLERYASYAGHPAEHGPLPPRLVELIYVALDASATHLFSAGLKLHIELALKAGATCGELHDVFHRVALQGMDRMCQAVGVLAQAARSCPPLPDESGGVGVDTDAVESPGSDDGSRRFRHRAGADVVRFLDRWDPGFATLMRDLIEDGRPEQGLSEPDRALIDVALHACFTGYDPLALSRAIYYAFELGLREAELLQAIQLGAHLSVHGTALGAGLLAEIDTIAVRIPTVSNLRPDEPASA
jgi:alkylhydroperoxidase/carboxymuconolactone decarboxylase family protein YurZ